MLFWRLWISLRSRVFDEMHSYQLKKLLGGEDDHPNQNMERSGVCIRGFASGVHSVGIRNLGLYCCYSWLFWCDGCHFRRSHCFFGHHCFHVHCSVHYTCALCHARTITHLMYLIFNVNIILTWFLLIFAFVIATLCYAITFPSCFVIVRLFRVAFYLIQVCLFFCSTLHRDGSILIRIVTAGQVFAAFLDCSPNQTFHLIAVYCKWYKNLMVTYLYKTYSCEILSSIIN